jgi:NagD protein
MLAAIEACTGARAEAVVGKPSAHMAAAVLARVELDPASVAVVGDRISTDVAMGRQIGAAGILVLSGATSAEDAALAEIRPDYIIDGIHQLLPQTQGRSR